MLWRGDGILTIFQIDVIVLTAAVAELSQGSSTVLHPPNAIKTVLHSAKKGVFFFFFQSFVFKITPIVDTTSSYKVICLGFFS